MYCVESAKRTSLSSGWLASQSVRTASACRVLPGLRQRGRKTKNRPCARLFLVLATIQLRRFGKFPFGEEKVALKRMRLSWSDAVAQ